MASSTVARPSTRYRNCLRCDNCGAEFNPNATLTLGIDLTNMGGGIVGPITRRPGVCLGCGRPYTLGDTNE